ncbi:hypothetical protein HL42_1438 [Trichophyton rubrum]|nr:hypothetical protein HL42_1438 [Trichophyton rubrum]
MADRSSSSTNQESNNDQTQSQSPHDSSTRNSDSDPFGLNKYIKPVSDPWMAAATPPKAAVKRRAGPPWPLREFNAFKPPARTHHEAGASRPPRHILFLDQASHAIDRKMLKRGASLLYVPFKSLKTQCQIVATVDLRVGRLMHRGGR